MGRTHAQHIHTIAWKRLLLGAVSAWLSCIPLHISGAEERTSLKSARVIQANAKAFIALSPTARETKVQLEPGALASISIPEPSNEVKRRTAILITSNGDLSFEELVLVTYLVRELKLTIAAEKQISSPLTAKNNTILLLDIHGQKYELSVNGTLYKILTSSEQDRMHTQPVEKVAISALTKPEKQMRTRIATLSRKVVKYVLSGQELPFWAYWNKVSQIVTIERSSLKASRGLSLYVFQKSSRKQTRSTNPQGKLAFTIRLLPAANSEPST